MTWHSFQHGTQKGGTDCMVAVTHKSKTASWPMREVQTEYCHIWNSKQHHCVHKKKNKDREKTKKEAENMEWKT